MRAIDLVISVGLVAFGVIALFADSINLLSGPGVVTDADLASLPHPRFMIGAFRWFVTMDPLLLANPPWLYAAFILNLSSMAFYAFAVPRLLRGEAHTVRPWALMWSGSMLTILFIIIVEEMAGPHKSPQPLAIAAAYGSYVVMPLLVAYRFLGNDGATVAGKKRK